MLGRGEATTTEVAPQSERLAESTSEDGRASAPQADVEALGHLRIEPDEMGRTVNARAHTAKHLQREFVF